MERTPPKKIQVTCESKFYPMMVSVNLGSSHHTYVCSSVRVSGKFGFSLIFDAIKTSGTSIPHNDHW